MKHGSLLLLLGLALPAHADIFTLKDGSKLDATIVSKTLDEYTLEVNVTSSIKEIRTIKRSEVVDHKIVSESDTEFEAIKDLAPAPPFLPTEGYEARIKTLKDFTDKHGLSSAGVKAKRMLRELESELAVIEKGGLKTESGLITPEEREQNALTYDSQLYANEFKRLVSDRAYIPAIRAYDKLETKTFGSKAHRAAVPLYEKLVTTYADAIARELDQFDSKEEQRQRTLEGLSEANRKRAEEIEREREERFAELREKEEADNVSWPSVNINDADSLDEILGMLDDEPRRIDAVKQDLADFEETGQLYQKAYQAAAAKDRETLEPILLTLEKARVGESYLDRLVELYNPEGSEQESE
ncbi:MAG: PTPDL family protein [Verrucomicrobiota bacterium JB023]|nr:PTPDL family protein [Verrucomicrobiota bacterium JB023]